MKYEVKNFKNLLGTKGFSDQLLKNHFTLYEGYVNNVNKLDKIIVGLEKEGKWGVPEYAELNRRFGWEWNGMRLHELYFENLTKEKSDEDEEKTALCKKIDEEFRSYEMWEKDFKTLGTIRGIGWVVLYYDKATSRLFNVWINEHDVGHLSGAVPILVMDVFEHAYMIDYGLKRANYIDSFFNAINWKVVGERLAPY